MSNQCTHKTIADNSNFFRTETIDSADNLFTELFPELFKMKREGWVFRGHSDSGYELIPSALRENKIPLVRDLGRLFAAEDEYRPTETLQMFHEYQIIRGFYRLANQRGLKVPYSRTLQADLSLEFDQMGGHKAASVLFSNVDGKTVWPPQDILEVAALAQHYGLPTRLLDWTYNPYVASFFCTQGDDKEAQNDKHMEIWCINLEYILQINENPNFWETKSHRDILREASVSIKSGLLETKSTLDNVLRTANAINNNNTNLHAQEGVLTFFQKRVDYEMKGSNSTVDRTPLCCLLEKYYSNIDVYQSQGPIVKSFKIPITMKHDLIIGLEDRGYDLSSIYPGLKGVAKEILKRSSLFSKYKEKNVKAIG